MKKLWDLLYCQQLLSDYALCCMDKLNIIKAFLRNENFEVVEVNFMGLFGKSKRNEKKNI